MFACGGAGSSPSATCKSVRKELRRRARESKPRQASALPSIQVARSPQRLALQDARSHSIHLTRTVSPYRDGGRSAHVPRARPAFEDVELYRFPCELKKLCSPALVPVKRSSSPFRGTLWMEPELTFGRESGTYLWPCGNVRRCLEQSRTDGRSMVPAVSLCAPSELMRGVARADGGHGCRSAP